MEANGFALFMVGLGMAIVTWLWHPKQRWIRVAGISLGIVLILFGLADQFSGAWCASQTDLSLIEKLRPWFFDLALLALVVMLGLWFLATRRTRLLREELESANKAAEELFPLAKAHATRVLEELRRDKKEAVLEPIRRIARMAENLVEDTKKARPRYSLRDAISRSEVPTPEAVVAAFKAERLGEAYQLIESAKREGFDTSTLDGLLRTEPITFETIKKIIYAAIALQGVIEQRVIEKESELDRSGP
jgi:hypothetical protein